MQILPKRPGFNRRENGNLDEQVAAPGKIGYAYR